jgi:hypothetical protein
MIRSLYVAARFDLSAMGRGRPARPVLPDLASALKYDPHLKGDAGRRHAAKLDLDLNRIRPEFDLPETVCNNCVGVRRRSTVLE